MRRMINIRTINTLIIVDIGIVIFCMLAGNRAWLISSQVGYFSSLLVVFASILSYRNMVKSSVANGLVAGDNDKVLEEIEDPHGLYEEQLQEIEEDEPKRGTVESLKQSRASLSLYRLGAYAILIIGFLIIDGNNLLHLPSYIFGIFIAPILAVGMIFLNKGKDENI